MSSWYWTIKGPEQADVLVLALSGLIVDLRHNPEARATILIARKLLTDLNDAIRRGEFR